MKRAGLLLLAAFLLAGSAGCFGPQKLTRQLDDFLNQQYVERPWLVGNVLSSTVIYLVLALTALVDGFLVNPIDFWTVSAQPFGKGVGTPFFHTPPTLPERK